MCKSPRVRGSREVVFGDDAKIIKNSIYLINHESVIAVGITSELYICVTYVQLAYKMEWLIAIPVGYSKLIFIIELFGQIHV